MKFPDQTVLARDNARNVDAILKNIIDRFHPAAAKELQKDNNQVERVRGWLQTRLEMLQPGKEDSVYTVLNAWNDQGLGCQSVSVVISRPSWIYEVPISKSTLLDNEWKSPTVGVIVPGLLHEDAPVAEVSFTIPAGKSEYVTGMSDHLHMDGKTDGPVEQLKQGTPLLVSGPAAVRTYMEVSNANPEKIRDVVHSGVYICCFLKDEAVASW